MKCIIIEDEPAAIEVLTAYIDRTPGLDLVATFREPLRALSYLRTNRVDLLFLDINMPELTGMELMNVIQDPPLVIFTTAYAEYAIESYEKNAVDYLLKPIPFQRFLKAVEKVQERLHLQKALDQKAQERDNESSENVIYIKSGTQAHRVNLNEVRYLEKDGHYMLFHLPGKKLIARLSMAEVFELISKDEFIQVHKSFIVARQFVQVIEAHQIRIDAAKIPIGKTFKKTVSELFETR